MKPVEKLINGTRKSVPILVQSFSGRGESHDVIFIFGAGQVTLFTVLYFSVRSSRSSALRYGLPSCMSVKTTSGAGTVWEEARKIEGL